MIKMIRDFTTEELMDRWEDRRDIQNLMVRFISQDYFFRRERDMYDKYWSRAENVSLGVNEGFYSGSRAVQGYYEAIHRRTELESKLIQKKYPNRLGSMTDEEIYGVGILQVKPLDTPVIEIAGDGETAKALYSIRGTNTRLAPGGHVSYWEFGWAAVDLVREGDEWKVWHLLYVQDIDTPYGTSWADTPPEYPDDEIFKAVRDLRFPEPNVKRSVRELYHTGRAFQPVPEYPVPYETFSETFSYGI